MAHVVIDLNDMRPVFGQPDWFSEEVRAALPPDWTLTVPEIPASGTGDGSAAAHPEVLEAVRDARIYMGFGISPQVIEAARNAGKS